MLSIRSGFNQGKPFCLAQQFILTYFFRIQFRTQSFLRHSTMKKATKQIKSQFVLTYGDTSYWRRRERSFSWCRNSRSNFNRTNEQVNSQNADWSF